jgi:putative ABC transport system substrate-binding protein
VGSIIDLACRSVVGPSHTHTQHTTALLEELRRDGFIEGKNLAIDYREFGQHVDLLPQYAAELIKAQVDVIQSGGGPATRAVQQATNKIPIVAIADDMVAEGLASSMAQPSGNTTGVSIFATELDGKRQENPYRGGARASPDGGPCGC